jgi:hypothetical protein
MRTRQLLIVAACLVSLGGAVVVLYGATKDKEPTKGELEQQLQGLLDDRVKTADRCVQATQAAYEAETVTLDRLLAAFENLKEARLAVAGSQAAIIDALEQHVDRLQNTHKKIELLYEVGAKGGEVTQMTEVKFAYETAQIELLRARISNIVD